MSDQNRRYPTPMTAGLADAKAPTAARSPAPRSANGWQPGVRAIAVRKNRLPRPEADPFECFKRR